MLALGAPLASLSWSQDDEKAKQLFEDAVEAMGGDAYRKIADVASEGQYFQFDNHGNSSPLIKYVDYIRLPDRNRTELGNRKKELDITIFNLEKNEGWILEGEKDIRAATPEEMKDFRSAAKNSIDNVFHSRYQDPENKLFYVGPGEGSEVTLEIVKLVDPENDETLVYFDRISKLPAKIEYRRVNRRGIRQRIVDEFSLWHVIEGVRTPMRIDGWTNGRRSSQQFVLKISYNSNLPDSLFSKPIPPKK